MNANKLKLYFAITIISTIILAFVTILPNQGKYKSKISLKDDETIPFDSLFNKFYENELDSLFTPIQLKHVILRAYDTDSNNITDLKTYIKSIIEFRNIGYWKIVPFITVSNPTYAFPIKVKDDDYYDWKKIDGFTSYYHTLFRNKAVRTILFKSALEFISSLCKVYPEDFKKRILNELEILLKFSNNIKFIDPKKEPIEYEDYWKGFLVRRHFSDEVPILEIQDAIIEALAKIKETPTQKEVSSMYQIDINNQISLHFSGEINYIASYSSSNRIILDENKPITSIRFLKDMTGDYYQISFKVGESTERLLINKNLEKVN